MRTETRLCLLIGGLLIVSTGITAASLDEASEFETVHTSNAAILNRLGLSPLQIPDGHHKKRLAGPEPPGLSSQTRLHQPYSRRHSHRDSHVYIVKLPASPPYYTFTKPHKSVKDDKATKTGPGLPMGFHSNGKPAKIYHWNLPVVKKITEKKRLQAQLRFDQARKKLEEVKKRQQTALKVEKARQPPDIAKKSHDVDQNKYFYGTDNRLVPHQKSSATKHVRGNDKRLTYPDNDAKIPEATRKSNVTSSKSSRLNDSAVHRIHLTNELHSRNSSPKVKKHRKKAAMSYYAPIAAKSGSTSIHKNFPGNGKPKAFYVMEKSRKPVYYHPLLP